MYTHHNLIRSVLILMFFSAFGLQGMTQINDDSLLIRTIAFLLEEKPDSAEQAFILIEVDADQRVELVSEVLEAKKPSYTQHQAFVSLACQMRASTPSTIANFVSHTITKPSNTEEINLKYAEAFWAAVMYARNENELELAIQLNKELAAYVAQFKGGSSDEIWARAYVKTHDIVMKQINGDLEPAFQWCQELIDEGVRIKDTTLIILGQYHQYDNYTQVRDLPSAIQIATETYELEKKLRTKTSYVQANLLHLLNVKIFEGKDFSFILQVLKELSETQNGDIEAYPYYAELASARYASDSLKTEIFKEFGTENVSEFAEQIMRQTEGKINQHDQIQMLKALAHGLKRDGFIDQSFDYLNEAMHLNQNLFSKDLANTLAEHQTDLALKEQELAFEFERKQKSWLITIAVILGLLIAVLVFVLIKQVAQSKSIKHKSAEIVSQNKEIAEREKEKELLFKEMHHRVKNNFQIISSLLEFQIADHTDTRTAQMIREVTNRIKSMSLIHQKLYENDDLHVNFDEYIIRLCEDLVNVYDTDFSAEITYQVEQTPLDIDTAVPLGLILNELVTNAFKHGFGTVNKTLDVSLKKTENGLYELQVKDNGNGLQDDIDLVSADSMGLRLIRRLAKQLQGGFEYEYLNGATFKVKFRDTETRKLVE